MLILLLLLLAIQDVLTGIFGAPSIVATMIASRAMSPRRAIYLSTFAQLVGPLLLGVAVASTVGEHVVRSQGITTVELCAALTSTIFWMILSWYLRIPSSSTHALIGGLVGAVLAALGPSAIQIGGLLKVIISLTLTAPLGLIGGFVVTHFNYWLVRRAHPQVAQRFNQGQLIASTLLGFAIGSTNAQNVMGITTLGLVVAGVQQQFEVPTWVIIGSAICLAMGNLLGGMRVIHTVGMKYFRIRPIHGFSAEVSSALIIAISALLGGNASTTHVTSMSIVGAGAAERIAMVRWGVVQRVIITWLLTIPMTALLAGLLVLLLGALGLR
ncbi:MAG: inorganic phosphate transporter [Anaerolineae bacterium]|nr:inorganic phosphate transporter [Anaerolineae bacterium]